MYVFVFTSLCACVSVLQLPLLAYVCVYFCIFYRWMFIRLYMRMCVCVYFVLLAYGYLVCFCAFMAVQLRLYSMCLCAAVYNECLSIPLI